MMNENEDPFIQTFADYFMTHSSGLSMSSKIFKYINVTPSLSLKSDWVNRSFTGAIDSTGTINRNEVTGIFGADYWLF
jgi:hypothetical protein